MMNIKDFIKIYPVINKGRCKEIVEYLDMSNNWESHSWYDANTKENITHDTKELEVNWSVPSLTNELHSYINQAIQMYSERFNLKDELTRFNPVRWNRYKTGTLMRPHLDHIRDIFDGTAKGIPLVTILGLLNDDFEGGNFLINGEKLNFKTGDIMIFPANFMYPHEVTEITNGVRQSFVSWGW